jgi:hypothetical protein
VGEWYSVVIVENWLVERSLEGGDSVRAWKCSGDC